MCAESPVDVLIYVPHECPVAFTKDDVETSVLHQIFADPWLKHHVATFHILHCDPHQLIKLLLKLLRTQVVEFLSPMCTFPEQHRSGRVRDLVP